MLTPIGDIEVKPRERGGLALAEELLADTSEGARRIRDRVRDRLSVSHSSQVVLTPLRIDDVLDQTLRLVAPARVARGVGARPRRDAHRARRRAAAGQVFLNLLSNARDAWASALGRAPDPRAHPRPRARRENRGRRHGRRYRGGGPRACSRPLSRPCPRALARGSGSTCRGARVGRSPHCARTRKTSTTGRAARRGRARGSTRSLRELLRALAARHGTSGREYLSAAVYVVFDDAFGLLLAPAAFSFAMLAVSFAQRETVIEARVGRNAQRGGAQLLPPRDRGLVRVLPRQRLDLRGARTRLTGSRESWLICIGLVANLWMGALFAAEYVYRHWRFRRYVGAPTDALLRRVFPPRFG